MWLVNHEGQKRTSTWKIPYSPLLYCILSKIVFHYYYYKNTIYFFTNMILCTCISYAMFQHVYNWYQLMKTLYKPFDSFVQLASMLYNGGTGVKGHYVFLPLCLSSLHLEHRNPFQKHTFLSLYLVYQTVSKVWNCGHQSHIIAHHHAPN